MESATPPLSLRERKKARLRLEMARVAVRLFKEHGFDATTVEQIAAEVETSPRTFFRYFGSKEDVLFGDVPDRLTHFRRTLAAAPPDASPLQTAMDALLEAVQNVSIFDDPHLESDLARIWRSEAAPRRRYMEIVMEWEETIAAFLADRWGREASGMECRVTAQALITAMRTAIDQGVQGRELAGQRLLEGFQLLKDGLRDPI